MSVLDISQEVANTLILMEKWRIDDAPYDFGTTGTSLSIPLSSIDKREDFLLDISRGRQINLLKRKYQTRARQAIILVRLDFAGAPHRNPNDEEIPCPHLHVYREGYGDKWAQPLPKASFPDPQNSESLLRSFMRYCNITQPPNIVRGLFQ